MFRQTKNYRLKRNFLTNTQKLALGFSDTAPNVAVRIKHIVKKCLVSGGRSTMPNANDLIKRHAVLQCLL